MSQVCEQYSENSTYTPYLLDFQIPCTPWTTTPPIHPHPMETLDANTPRHAHPLNSTDPIPLITWTNQTPQPLNLQHHLNPTCPLHPYSLDPPTHTCLTVRFPKNPQTPFCRVFVYSFRYYPILIEFHSIDREDDKDRFQLFFIRGQCSMRSTGSAFFLLKWIRQQQG